MKKVTVVPLSKATAASCGAKAAACAELATLAEQSKKNSSFGTAQGVCLPFGCMEAVIKVGRTLQQERECRLVTNRATRPAVSAQPLGFACPLAASRQDLVAFSSLLLPC